MGVPTAIFDGRVEEGRGGLRHCQLLRFPSPLIKPDVRISRIRLSDWIHRISFGPEVSASVSLTETGVRPSACDKAFTNGC
jgi:hypothetical protein